MKQTKIIAYILIICFSVISCKKDWLDAKPDLSLVVPKSLEDYKSMMAGTNAIGSPSGGAFNDRYGTIVEHMSGDFFVRDSRLNALISTRVLDANAYLWKPDLWNGHSNYGAWIIPYNSIFYTNIVLEGIETIQPANNSELLDWKQVKGSALFFRAAWHYDIAKQFCKPYNKTSATVDLGIPLRLQSDFNELSVRSTVQQTYHQITDDLKLAASLFPIDAPINIVYKTVPTRSAAFAMLARIYLSMSDFDSAFKYADKSLALHSQLLNYNGLNSIPAFNPEVILQMKGASYSFFGSTTLVVDSILLRSYTLGDLRKRVYFKRQGSDTTISNTYDGSTTLWTGLATDEMYLIRAECYARKGEKNLALADLNTLLEKRWQPASWSPITTSNANEALIRILLERRKELCFRALRWTDLRRLNMESQFATTLNKIALGTPISLPPNSLLYTLLIPPNVIQLSGIPQNPR